MGTKMTPSYVNQFIGFLNNNLQSQHKSLWFFLRFIDVIVMIWSITEED